MSYANAWKLAHAEVFIVCLALKIEKSMFEVEPFLACWTYFGRSQIMKLASSIPSPWWKFVCECSSGCPDGLDSQFGSLQKVFEDSTPTNN